MATVESIKEPEVKTLNHLVRGYKREAEESVIGEERKRGRVM